MKTITQKLLLFVSGVVVGVAGITFWEIFGKPTLPTPEYDGWADVFQHIPVPDPNAEHRTSWAMDKTQPIRVEL